MMIAFSPANLLCELEEEYVQELIIENQIIFQNVIFDIYQQMCGIPGNFILSEDYHPLEMRKKAELITQIIPFDLNQKELLNKLYSELKINAVNENNYQDTQDLFSYISKYLFKITGDAENELIYDTPDDISGILKAFNVRFNDENTDLPEKILEYMTAVRNLKGERVFFFVNLRSYLTDKQAELLFKSILLRKMTTVCIENCEHTRLSCEKVTIIDKDMCVI